MEQLLYGVLESSPNLLEILFSSITVQGLMHIASSHFAPSLRIIRAQVDENALEAAKSICKVCPNLIVFDLDHDCLDNGDDLVLTAVKYCPLIEVPPTDSLSLTDVSMKALSTIHTLREFKLFSSNCTCTGIQRVLQSNPNLTLLSINITEVNDALVRCIGHYCRNLQSLEFIIYESPSGLTDSALDVLFSGCPLLSVYKLKLYDGALTTTALQAIFQYGHNNIIELELSMRELEPVVVVPELNIQPVLGAPYPTLTKLSVEGDGIAGTALHDIFTYCTNLRTVELSYCKHVTDDTITALAQHCGGIESLHISGCTNVTIAGMVEVATHCSSLRHFSIFAMSTSDDFLIQLSLLCRSITRLSLWSCKGGPITETGILAVIEECTSLTSLTVRDSILMPLTRTLELMQQKQLYTHIEFDLR